MLPSQEPPGYLLLEDGTRYDGWLAGRTDGGTGEVVFTTNMTGYQEVLTDPSYRGQIVAMTYPEIGNYGISDTDGESERPQVAGFVMRWSMRRGGACGSGGSPPGRGRRPAYRSSITLRTPRDLSY